MWIKAAVLGGSGILFSNLAVWTMAGLGIKIAFHSSCKWVNSVVLREENDNEIDRLRDEENDNEIDRLSDEENDNEIDQLPAEENDNKIDRLSDEENDEDIEIDRLPNEVKDDEIDRLVDEEKDNEIDQLPDDILGDIVSRLELIEASRTSILSRRWRNLWTTKSELVFTCVSTFDILNKQVANGDKQSFLKVVDQCLQLYSYHGRKVRMILLPYCFLKSNTCLVRWMQTLARHEVEKIALGNPCETCNRDVTYKKECTFSFKLLDGLSRLKNLRITSCYLETSFVGQCILLTRIYLVGLLLASHQLSDILTSCPNLGYLIIRRCELPLSLRISGPNLKLDEMEISGCTNMKRFELSDTNVTFACIDMNNEVEFSLSSLPKMKQLNLRALGINYCFGDVTTDLPELQWLMIKTPFQVHRLPPTFRAFHKIRKLIILTSGHPHQERSARVDLWNFAPVLDACPFLVNLYVSVGGPVRGDTERNAKWLPVVARQHKHLRSVELSGFSNTQNELEFAKFILTSAEVLFMLMLRVCPRVSDFVNGCYIDESEKDSKQIDYLADLKLCADLQRHALPNHVIVTLH